jgi:hypothetical protein
MSNRPSHIAYVVSDPKEGNDRRAQWHQVGSIWPHKSGTGFDLITFPGVALTGRIVCIERKDKEPDAA